MLATSFFTSKVLRYGGLGNAECAGYLHLRVVLEIIEFQDLALSPRECGFHNHCVQNQAHLLVNAQPCLGSIIGRNTHPRPNRFRHVGPLPLIKPHFTPRRSPYIIHAPV